MTVKRLKKIIEELPDDMTVTVGSEHIDTCYAIDRNKNTIDFKKDEFIC